MAGLAMAKKKKAAGKPAGAEPPPQPEQPGTSTGSGLTSMRVWPQTTALINELARLRKGVSVANLMIQEDIEDWLNHLIADEYKKGAERSQAQKRE